MHLLDDTNAIPSIVYDLESFLWVLLYCLLRHHYPLTSQEDLRYYKAVSPHSTYYDDYTAKFVQMSKLKGTSNSDILDPYWPLLQNLANIASSFHDIAEDGKFSKTKQTYTLAEEERAMEEYLRAIESSLDTYGSEATNAAQHVRHACAHETRKGAQVCGSCESLFYAQGRNPS